MSFRDTYPVDTMSGSFAEAKHGAGVDLRGTCSGRPRPVGMSEQLSGGEHVCSDGNEGRTNTLHAQG